MSFFFFNDTATTEIYTLSLHDALPISTGTVDFITTTFGPSMWVPMARAASSMAERSASPFVRGGVPTARKMRSEEHTSDSSHLVISYAVFCLKKKKQQYDVDRPLKYRV